MKILTYIFFFHFIVLFAHQGLLQAQGGGRIYLKSTEVPRLSKTPANVNLRSPQGSDRVMSVRAAIGEKRLDTSRTKGDAGGGGRLHKFQKFVRVDIRGVTQLIQPKVVKVEMGIREGTASATRVDTVTIAQFAPNLVIDCNGYQDTFGTEVKNRTSGNTITSTKYKHAEADIVSVYITIYDAKETLIYSGAWPNPSNDSVNLPERLRPRVFTSAAGKKLTGSVSNINAASVTLKVKGKDYLLPRTKLSQEDQDYLTNTFADILKE